jgi:hypothetical protein
MNRFANWSSPKSWWLACMLWVCGMALGVEQPVPFSHKKHAGQLKLPCKTCHAQPVSDGEMMLPPEKVCAGCHVSAESTSDGLKQLNAYLKLNKSIPWKRVYNLPSYVFWSHEPHLDAGATCQKCHGLVAEREQLLAEVSHKMADCVACHRAEKASTDCTFCHEPRR